MPNRARGLGECRTGLPWGPKSGQAGAGHGPLDNCSSQPFLISGEISRVQLSAMHTRIKSPAEAAHNAPALAGVREEGLLGSLWPLSFLPSPHPVPHLPCSALSIVHDAETLSFPSPPSLAAVGCAVGPWGPWSGCSSPCGVGSRARSRQVTVPPRHGGDPCPDLKQRRGCLGQHPACGTAKGNVGCLLPSCVVVPVCCRPCCPSRGVFNHPRAPHSRSSARGSQDTAQLLQPGLQRSLAKSWAATAGGALWVCVELGPLCSPPSPKLGPLCTPPCIHDPFATPRPRAFFLPLPLLFSLPQTTTLLHPHTKPRPFACP